MHTYGTSEATAIRVAPAFRVLFSLVALFFTGGLLTSLGRYEAPWWLWLAMAGLALITLMGAGAAFTERIWVAEEQGSWAIHEKVLGRHHVFVLTEATRLTFASTSATPLTTVWGNARLTLTQPAHPRLHHFVTPWLGDVGRLLELLAPALRLRPELATDRATLVAFEAAGRP